MSRSFVVIFNRDRRPVFNLMRDKVRGIWGDRFGGVDRSMGQIWLEMQSPFSRNPCLILSFDDSGDLTDHGWNPCFSDLEDCTGWCIPELKKEDIIDFTGLHRHGSQLADVRSLIDLLDNHPKTPGDPGQTTKKLVARRPFHSNPLPLP